MLNILYLLLLSILRQVDQNRPLDSLGIGLKVIQLILLEESVLEFLNEHVRRFSFRISLLMGKFTDHFRIEHLNDVVLVDLGLNQLLDLQ
jgi:hypothetical protein